MSGRRGLNPRPAAWKAAALPTELLPLEKNLADIGNLFIYFSLFWLGILSKFF